MGKKDAYYFPHFSNARHDRKIKRLVKDLGLEGYGIFFMLLEVLREQTDLKYPLADLDLLADEFGCSEAKLKAVVNSYDLFTTNGEEFISPKLVLYLQPYYERIDKASKAAKARWNKVREGNELMTQNAQALPENCASNARKGNEIKPIIIAQDAPDSFEVFYGLYNYKRDRKKAIKAWDKLSDSDRKKAIDKVESFKSDYRKRGINLPYPATYLNGRRFEDEIDKVELLDDGVKLDEQIEEIFQNLQKHLNDLSNITAGITRGQFQEIWNLEYSQSVCNHFSERMPVYLETIKKILTDTNSKKWEAKEVTSISELIQAKIKSYL